MGFFKAPIDPTHAETMWKNDCLKALERIADALEQLANKEPYTPVGEPIKPAASLFNMVTGRWSGDEVKILRQMLREGKSNLEIAQTLRRDTKSVENKVYSLKNRWIRK